MPNSISSAAAETRGPNQASGELLDVNQIAHLLNCSPRTVHRLADGGKMPRPVKLGALTRWSRAAVEAWIADGCKPVRRLKGGVQ